jgi:3-oxoacyl-[acyl-carrier protein] reductase
MDLGLRGRGALVTASSTGLGRAIALTLAAEGADLAMCARGAERLEASAAAVREHGGRVVARVADVSTLEGATSAVAAAVDGLGRLDILVVNAGGPPAGTFETLDDAAWHAAMELTLMSAVRLIRAALPHLRWSDAASILVVSSYSVKQPIPDLLLSNSLRLGVVGLAKSLSVELGPEIRINTLLPGNISTDRARSLAASRAEAAGVAVDQVEASIASQAALGRYGTPEEFARAATFLVSPAASYITGQAIACDGGIIRFPL